MPFIKQSKINMLKTYNFGSYDLKDLSDACFLPGDFNLKKNIFEIYSFSLNLFTITSFSTKFILLSSSSRGVEHNSANFFN
jgi:hypothetical protein